MSKWDERYLTDDYVFGTEPNQFIARILPLLPKGGRALDLATGEGRNGIFLAEHGFEAEGVDMSAVGLEKAQKLAAEKGVRFATRQENIAEMALPPEHYALIASVFCHFAEPVRTQEMTSGVEAASSGRAISTTCAAEPTTAAARRSNSGWPYTTGRQAA